MHSRHDHSEDSGIRKAAILVACLDRATADAVLERLGPEQTRRVRELLVDLEEIDPKEQRTVIDEFLRVGPMVPAKDPPGIELAGELARTRLARQTRAADDAPSALRCSALRPFGFLHEAEADKLARVLSGERPQTIALVLSHLPPQQSGSILVRLQPVLQTEVVHRLVDLEETDPEILREVERALESRLSEHVSMQRRRVAGMKAIADILEASDGQVGTQILESLVTHDRALAERFSRPATQFTPPAMQFADLARLDDDTLDAVFDAADRELAITALVGASPELIDRALQRFASPQSEAIRRRLEQPGPIRLSDVEDAQQQIADLAGRLASEGRIELPDCQPTFVC
ncbi:MAG: hypothetical protein A2V70_11960 [Planctomycetes bacterium RBG_13_63_9]|nr:MAG: hypothetical protein A2V70_11960 [Planctomycetes bacterium RBG_13_63_9]